MCYFTYVTHVLAIQCYRYNYIHVVYHCNLRNCAFYISVICYSNFCNCAISKCYFVTVFTYFYCHFTQCHLNCIMPLKMVECATSSFDCVGIQFVLCGSFIVVTC